LTKRISPAINGPPAPGGMPKTSAFETGLVGANARSC